MIKKHCIYCGSRNIIILGEQIIEDDNEEEGYPYAVCNNCNKGLDEEEVIEE